MNAIVAVCDDWGIGLEGQLLVHSRADMHRFVELTMGCTVVMGRRTLASFPGGPLKGRRNVVVTHDPASLPEGVVGVTSPEAALAAVAGEDPSRVWLIGGESVYRALLPHCARAYVTKFDVTLPADAFFPNLDEDPAWRVESVEEGGVTKRGKAFSFVTYAHDGQ
ncbi:MAG: dihydrofolate reductase [Coriobacteriaceae bacterium]|jgi:dihydrofolate reductase|nr:dihydrofolate reductase [Olsenella sp.]MCI1289965.1 dihydrofolate reductase [Olsenella sp.]RRF90126.1 MAG: dihydrofolate reductase [Coriobacteriaceae bacterium]